MSGLKAPLESMSNLSSLDAFMEYHAGKLVVRNGCVHLLPAGWAEYGPAFSKANLVLQDGMLLEDFKRSVRVANRTASLENEAALRALLQDLRTPIAEKQLIRSILEPQAGVAAQTATILKFPARAV